jgi:molybdopterin-binding protein
VGVAALERRRPGQLSGGQAQRVAVARALAADPEVLLLDEPMAALDVAVTPALRQTLRGVLADRTALLITHDVLDALLLADRVVVVEEGRIVEQGPTQQVLSAPRSAFAARLAGLDLVAGTWDGRALVTPAGVVVTGLTEEPLRPGDQVAALFRPAAVSVFAEPPGGSPRNHLDVTVTDLEPLGDRIRVRGAHGDVHLAADVTPAAVAELGLAAGAAVTFAVKATEVTVYGTFKPDQRSSGAVPGR